MSDKSNKIFLPEAGQPVIDAIGAHHNTGYEVQVGDMPLRTENGQMGALDRLKVGEFAAVIAGARYSSAEVIKAGLEVIGSEDGLISSFFAMESKESPSSENRFFLADCAVIPAPSKKALVKITEQTCVNIEKLGVRPVVAFLSPSTEHDAGSHNAVDEAIELFIAKNSGRATVGRVSWGEATNEDEYNSRTGLTYPDGQHPNLFVFPNLNSGNIVYKVLQDPDARGWKSAATHLAAYVLEKDGRQIVLSNNEKVPVPSGDQLVELAEDTCEGIQDPVVAFLSFSTEGSSPNQEAVKVGAAAKAFRLRHPDIPTFGEIQWDAARDEYIYKLKTGNSYPEGGAPNVFIFPNLDSADTAYRIMQQPNDGGLTAVGPMLQGFKGGTLLIDLSRGVNEEAGIAVVRLTGQLAGLRQGNTGHSKSI